MTTKRRLAYLALLFNSLIWGAAFPLIKPAFAFLTPLAYLYLRFLVAGLVALPIFLYFYIKIRPKISYLIKVLLIELLGLAFPLAILYEGLSRTSALEASLIGAIGPIFVVAGGILFLNERETKREWQGLAVALLGSLVLVAEPLFSGQTLDTTLSMSGNLLVLGYDVLWAVYAILAKKYYRSKPPLYVGSLTYLVTAGIYALFLIPSHSLPSLQLLSTPAVLIPVLYMAIPGGILAFILYLYAQSKIEVSEANLFTYLNGVVAIPASFLLLGEKPTLVTILAILLIAAGVLRAENRSYSGRVAKK